MSRLLRNAFYVCGIRLFVYPDYYFSDQLLQRRPLWFKLERL